VLRSGRLHGASARAATRGAGTGCRGHQFNAMVEYFNFEIHVILHVQISSDV
jgi:hypothetical protein